MKLRILQLIADMQQYVHWMFSEVLGHSPDCLKYCLYLHKKSLAEVFQFYQFKLNMC